MPREYKPRLIQQTEVRETMEVLRATLCQHTNEHPEEDMRGRFEVYVAQQFRDERGGLHEKPGMREKTRRYPVDMAQAEREYVGLIDRVLTPRLRGGHSREHLTVQCRVTFEVREPNPRIGPNDAFRTARHLTTYTLYQSPQEGKFLVACDTEMYRDEHDLRPSEMSHQIVKFGASDEAYHEFRGLMNATSATIFPPLILLDKETPQ